jgi:hypothetical protein
MQDTTSTTTQAKPTTDAVAFLAAQVITGDALLAAVDRGWRAAVEVLGPAFGGLTYGADGVARQSSAAGKRVELRVGEPDAAPVTVPLRLILEHAVRCATAADVAALRSASAEHAAATTQIHPTPEDYRRHVYTPERLTRPERARIAAGEAAQRRAERRMRGIVGRRLTVPTATAGEQLELFGPGEAGAANLDHEDVAVHPEGLDSALTDYHAARRTTAAAVHAATVRPYRCEGSNAEPGQDCAPDCLSHPTA